MESHRRRQAILALLQELGEVSVEDLANRFNVSANTIRTDLSIMERDGLLSRVRGGATLPVPGDAHHHGFALRSRANRREKQAIARWAAELVKDGDAIILDASSTVFHLATWLRERRHLTVVAGGLEVALLLAQEPTNKVILAADTVRPNGNSLVGDLNPNLLSNFRASQCFVSCSSCSTEQGLTEADVDVATLKAQLIKLARQVIALVDHSKFEEVGAFRFAQLNQIDQLVTDAAIARDKLEALRRVGRFPITLVSVDSPSVETVQPITSGLNSRRYRIGFGNMSEKRDFCRKVRQGLERAAAQLGNVDLLIRDNELSRQTSLQNAAWFVANRVDLVIEFQADSDAGNIIMDQFNRAGIPVIAVDIPLPGATFFGADNYRAGFLAGEGLGYWVKRHWRGNMDILLKLLPSRIGPTAQARLQGMVEGLTSVIGPLLPDKLVTIDTPILFEEVTPVISNWLLNIPPTQRVAIVAIDDDAAVGALLAFEQAGRLNQVVAVGQGVNQVGREALRRPGFPFVCSTSYAPEQYGERLLDTALRILRGECVPPAIYTQHLCITKQTVDQYYPEEATS